MPETDTSTPVSLWRLLSLARPELGILTIATVALVINSALSLVFPQAVRWMVDAITGEATPFDFDTAAIVLVVLFGLSAVFGMLRSWLYTIAGERVVARLRTDLYAAIVQQDIAFFDVTRTGELTNRLASDTSVLQNTVTVNISMALRFGAGAIGGIGMLFWMSPTLSGVALAVVPVVAIGAALYGRLIRGLSKDVQDALAQSTEVAEETLSGVRTVRSFAREQTEMKRYNEAVDRSYALAAKRALALGVFNGAMGFAGYAAIALVVWYGGRMVTDGRMTVGDLTAFLLYTLMVAMALGALSSLYGDFMRATGASQRVFQLLETKATLESDEGERLQTIRGDVVFDSVGFTYPARPDIPVLTNVSFRLQPGELVALVGPSGSGKSTIAALLARFYDPQEGFIAVDGHPLTTLAPREWREHVGTVAQEPILFATTIAENIRYGRPEATDDEVREAARAANADGFVDAFPEGFNTLVGERGVRLSGGQKQRIAIARAVLKDPAILVLDEATSALDSESEHLVQEALDRLMRGRTTLVIAHRLSTIQDAHRVVVLEGGEVREQGTHDELLAHNGIYRRLVERQFQAA